MWSNIKVKEFWQYVESLCKTARICDQILSLRNFHNTLSESSLWSFFSIMECLARNKYDIWN